MPDCEAIGVAESILYIFSRNTSQDLEVAYSNILIINAFRALLFKKYAHLQHFIQFYSEGVKLDMDANMRCDRLWDNPGAKVGDEILEMLLDS